MKQHTIHESERVVKHQLFQFAIVMAAPERAFQECVADEHFAPLGVVTVKSRATDDGACRSLDDGKRAFRRDRSIEESLKDFPRVTIRLRVLLPNEWIAGG